MSYSYWGKRDELHWPELESGEPEAPALLCDAASRDEIQRVMMLMRGYGIPAIEKMPKGRPFSTVLFGTEILGAEVFVPQSLLEDARELLNSPPPEEEPAGDAEKSGGEAGSQTPDETEDETEDTL